MVCRLGHLYMAMFDYLLSLLFKHRYVPRKFVQSTIVPLVKCKGGDLTDVNNYRAIMPSNSVTQTLETALINNITTYGDCEAYQFEFKKNHSTAQCTNLLKQTVDIKQNEVARSSYAFLTPKKPLIG